MTSAARRAECFAAHVQRAGNAIEAKAAATSTQWTTAGVTGVTRHTMVPWMRVNADRLLALKSHNDRDGVFTAIPLPG